MLLVMSSDKQISVGVGLYAQVQAGASQSEHSVGDAIRHLAPEFKQAINNRPRHVPWPMSYRENLLQPSRPLSFNYKWGQVE